MIPKVLIMLIERESQKYVNVLFYRIQRVDLSSGENTRVFVGPEHQQASARLVATSLEKDMRLHGIVISYQPFSL